MTEDSNWKIQYNKKLENDLLNCRGQTAEEVMTLYREMLALLEEHKEPIALALAQVAPQRQPAPAPVVPTGPRPIVAPAPSGREVGPVYLEGVDVKPAKFGQMYIVKWDGAQASTFDALIGKAAQGFHASGHPCFLTIEPAKNNPRFTNLISIRMAA